MNAMKILIAALLVLTLGGSAMAASSQTTQVSASLSSYISLAVPSSISGLTLNQGDNTFTPKEGLTVNSNAPWHISVQTAKGIPDPSSDYVGHFWSPTAYSAGLGANLHGPGFLASPLVLNAGSGDAILTDEQSPLLSGFTIGSTPVSFVMKQKVAITDPAENDYRIVIQFTANN